MLPSKVLRIVSRMNAGGPAIEISMLMQELPSTAYDQLLVCGRCGENEEDFLAIHQVSYPVSRLDDLGRSISLARDLRMFWSIRRLIQANGPVIVHTHTAKAGVLGRLAALSLRTQRPKIVHTFHGHLLHGYFGARKTKLVVTVEALLARKTDVLVSVGHRVASELVEAGIGNSHKYRVIHSGIELGTLPKRAEARQRYGIASDSQVILLMGRLTAIKRPDRALEVIRLLRESYSRALLVVAGSGEMEAEMRAIVEAQDLPVVFLGWLNEVEGVLAASDVLVITSDNEGTPLSLGQAALAHVPCVSTDVGSVSEMLVSGETGFLTSSEPGDIAAKVGQLLDDEPLRRSFGSAASIHIRASFSKRAFIESHNAMYAELLQAEFEA